MKIVYFVENYSLGDPEGKVCKRYLCFPCSVRRIVEDKDTDVESAIEDPLDSRGSFCTDCERCLW